MGNSEVSSANNLTVDVISIDWSLIQIRKSRGPKLDHCGRPALTGNQSDVRTFETAL